MKIKNTNKHIAVVNGKKILKKNPSAKMRTVDNPYEIWKSPDGTWEWRVLKKWQIDDDKPYARWFCAVKSPMTFGRFDMGDVYVKDIKDHAIKLGNNSYFCLSEE